MVVPPCVYKNYNFLTEVGRAQWRDASRARDCRWSITSCRLIERQPVALVLACAPFEACQVQMRQRLERRRHHMKNRPFFAAEHFLRDLVRTFRLAPNQVEHLRFAIPMVLDELVCAMGMVVEDAAVRRYYQLHVETLDLAL